MNEYDSPPPGHRIQIWPVTINCSCGWTFKRRGFFGGTAKRANQDATKHLASIEQDA